MLHFYTFAALICRTMFDILRARVTRLRLDLKRVFRISLPELLTKRR